MTRRRKRKTFGSVYQQGGRWRVRFPDPTKPPAKSGRASYTVRAVESEAEGSQYLRNVRRVIMAGRYAPTPERASVRKTVAEAFEEFVTAKRAEGCAESTLTLYRYTLKPLHEHGLARMRVGQVETKHVEDFLAWRRTHVWKTVVRQGGRAESVPLPGILCSNTTLRRDRQVLSGVFGRMHRHGVLNGNPVAGVKPARATTRPKHPLSKAEATRLLLECDPLTLRPLVLTGMFTGARKCELLDMRWGYIRFQGKSIAFPRRKTGTDSTIALHPVLEEELHSLRDRRATETGRIPGPDDFVFHSRLRRPYKEFKSGWAAARKRAGLDHLKGATPGCLRTTFATHYLEDGAAVTDLQRILGHRLLKTTQRYAQAIEARARDSLVRMSYDPESEDVRTQMRTPDAS